MAKLTPAEQQRILREAERYAKAHKPQISRVLKRLGPIGRLLQAIADAMTGGTREPSARELDEAAEILRGQGFNVRRPGEPEPPPVRGQGPQPPMVRRVPQPPPVPVARVPGREPAEDPTEDNIQILPKRIRGAMTQIGDDIKGFSAWVLTPHSSNVHAVAYDYDEGMLYVQFRAEGKPIAYKDSISICSGEAYKVGIRPDVPGPIYSYGGAGRKVPPEIFNAIANGRSPGKEVWDKLRVCGSQWQHKFPYTLTDVPAGQNVPRKATRRGLRVRTVPTVGMGRRGGRQSTLPASGGRIRR